MDGPANKPRSRGAATNQTTLVATHARGSAADVGLPPVPQFPWIALRACLVLLGILMLGGGIVGFLVPDVMHSGDPRNHWVIDSMIHSGALGYGFLLCASPGALARTPWKLWSLLVLTLVFVVGVGVVAVAHVSVLRTALEVAARCCPAGLAMILVIREARRPQSIQYPTGAPSGAVGGGPSPSYGEFQGPVSAIGSIVDDEVTARRQKSAAILRAREIPVLESLPAIASEAESTRRPTRVVALRAMALCVVALKGEGLEQELVDGLVADLDLAGAFSPAEKRFILDQDPSDHDRTQFAWRYECYWVLLWALGFVSELSWPSGVCDVPGAVQTLHDKGRDGFLSQAHLRPQNEILDAADLTYRLHWAVTDARLRGRPALPSVEGGVVLERHHALNWLIGHADQEWDDVSTDT